MPRCIGYIRVSTQKQADEGLSLEAQTSRIQEWALSQDLPCTIYSDAISGRNIDKREGLKEALSALQQGDTLCVYSLSRLSRSTQDTLQLLDQVAALGAKLHSLSERVDVTTASGKLMTTLTAVFAEYEVNTISERVRFGIKEKQARHEHIGRPPYGWKLRDGPKSGLVPDTYEQQVIAVAKEERNRPSTISQNGCKSYQEIADLLQLRGYKTRQGTTLWHKRHVMSMIQGKYKHATPIDVQE